MPKTELDALVVKRSADLAIGDRVKVTRSFEGASLKADLAENTITVVASTVGTADDRSGDVIFPGAYKSCIPGFLLNGFVAIGHEWDELPVAMPTECKEEGHDLICTATFHTTATAQEARTVCKERMEAGKSVSLSVGFMPDYSDDDGVVWFAKGADLLAWATGKGIDLSGFDEAGIKKLGPCRAITKIAELFEWSIVGVGMNRGAKALAVKSAVESEAEGKTFDEHFFEALGSLDSLLTRWEGISEKRATLGESHRDKLSQILDRLTPLAVKSEATPSEPAPGAAEKDSTNSEEDEAKAVRYRELTFRTLSNRTALASAKE